MNALLKAITEEDQQSFNELAVNFTRATLADCLHEYEYPYRLDPSDMIRKINDLGFLSVNLPEEYGGLGLGFQPLAGILEQVSLIDAGIAGTIFANAAAIEIISIASSMTSCENIFELISRPDALTLAFQAYAGPSETSIPTSVKKDGTYTLHGKADLLVSGTAARYGVIPAVSGDGSYSYFLVDLADRKIKKSEPVITIGMQSCRPVDIGLNGAPCLLIGKEGDGRLLFEEMSRRMSYPACGILLGIMKGSFNTAVEYCGERYQGGRMIIEWGEVRKKLSDMASLIALAETSMLGLKNMFASGHAQAGPSAVAASIHIGNIAADVTSDGIQLLGGNGYMKDYGQEKRMRDAKQAQCLLGSSLLRKKRCMDAIIKEKFEATTFSD